MNPLKSIKNAVRGVMQLIARSLNALSGGKLSPNAITVIGILGHLLIAYWLVYGYLVYAGVWLIVFGLFDTLDGELARLQKRTTAFGMFFDSTADRIKEIMIYVAVIYYNTRFHGASGARENVFIVAALGISLLITYLNAWGEAVIAHHASSPNQKMNKTFRNGVLGFEVRMFLLVVGLLFNQLHFVVILIVVLGSITVLQRFASITKRLKHVQG